MAQHGRSGLNTFILSNRISTLSKRCRFINCPLPCSWGAGCGCAGWWNRSWRASPGSSLGHCDETPKGSATSATTVSTWMTVILCLRSLKVSIVWTELFKIVDLVDSPTLNSWSNWKFWSSYYFWSTLLWSIEPKIDWNQLLPTIESKNLVVNMIVSNTAINLLYFKS